MATKDSEHPFLGRPYVGMHSEGIKKRNSDGIISTIFHHHYVVHCVVKKQKNDNFLIVTLLGVLFYQLHELGLLICTQCFMLYSHTILITCANKTKSSLIVSDNTSG